MPNFLRFLLFPFALLYGIAIWIRNSFYDFGILHQHAFDLPVISVGNLSVGGTGKTPHIEYLITLLKAEQLEVAVLSRGYKRSTSGFVLAGRASTVSEIGDEPLQIKQKFPAVHVAVHENRVEGIKALREHFPKLDLILLDDAYQHRRVKAGLSILLTDFNRPFYKDYLLPAGRLREFRRNKNRADIIVLTKSPSGITEADKAKVITKVRPRPHQSVFFSSIVYHRLYLLNSPEEQMDPETLAGHIYLITGVANPRPIQEFIKARAILKASFTFPDHHDFKPADLQQLNEVFAEDREQRKYILTTEKDAVKLSALRPSIPIWVLPVSMEPDDASLFEEKILSFVRREVPGNLQS